jgi:hypothetical protein
MARRESSLSCGPFGGRLMLFELVRNFLHSMELIDHQTELDLGTTTSAENISDKHSTNNTSIVIARFRKEMGSTNETAFHNASGASTTYL